MGRPGFGHDLAKETGRRDALRGVGARGGVREPGASAPEILAVGPPLGRTDDH